MLSFGRLHAENVGGTTICQEGLKARMGYFSRFNRLSSRGSYLLRRQLRTIWTNSSDLMGLFRYSVAPAFMASKYVSASP